MGFELRGRVQGVGCRPWVYRLAVRRGLSGFVRNDAAGVRIEVQGEAASVAGFMAELQVVGLAERPALLEVSEFVKGEMPLVEGEAGFRIADSASGGDALAGVTPDTAVCGACLAEMQDAGNFRYRYPFITCTHCGPRYSIIQRIPYDRPMTTMGAFALCGRCRGQYEDAGDRRFHAQPVACGACGPRVRLTDAAGAEIEGDSDAAIARAAALLREGKIVAIKGIGGFHLAVDALNEGAVVRLRQRKRRQAKPFAMMAADAATVGRYAAVDDISQKLLESPQRPIVLVEKRDGGGIAPSVAEGTSRFGFMLCYAPLHYLLFGEAGISVLVMTSANFSEEPLICDNGQAVEELGDVADAFLMHDRGIYRQTDDSVVQVVDGGAAFLRRGRGYVPEALYRERASERVIFAAGADLKNTFCFLKGDQYLVSEHIGDLAEGRAYRHYIRSVGHFERLFEAAPAAVVCDLHPGYLSSHFAEGLGIAPLIRVQHHWAHAASAMAEYNHAGPVIGLIADGTGYGTDGAIWGCECLIATLKEFRRFGHLAYFPLAGGDRAAKEAIRPLVGLLSAEGRYADVARYGDVVERIEADGEKVRLICEQIGKGVNVTPTSSLGRLFDAAAAVIGAGTCNRFEAELPMALEALTRGGGESGYPVELVQQGDGVWLWRYEAIVEGMIQDVRAGAAKAAMATRFHNAVCDGMLGLSRKAREATGLTTVALSGGVFCNRYLAERMIRRLKDEGFCVLWKRRVPVNDGGVSLGQAAIGAAMVEKH